METPWEVVEKRRKGSRSFGEKGGKPLGLQSVEDEYTKDGERGGHTWVFIRREVAMRLVLGCK